MEFSIKTGHPEKQRTACLIVPVYESRRFSPCAEKIDALTEGVLNKLAQRGDLEGKALQTLLIPQVPGLPAERLLILGCGKKALSDKQYREIIGKIITTLSHTGAQEATFYIDEVQVKDRSLAWKIRQAVQYFEQAIYRFDDYKTQKENLNKPLRRIVFIVANRKAITEAERAVQTGNAIAHGITFSKNLANHPANICTPTFIAEKAKQFAKQHPKVNVAVLEEKEMAALGMGALLSVTAGSTTPAKFITLEYRGQRKEVKPIVLVGKGITFDTGGNSIKVPPYMIGMKYDMCGAATVLGTLLAAAELELPLNIIGVIPTCENRIGSNATRPEDIVTSMSGLTIEILNTDAEGRLILADALTYSERFQPDVVIDIATLTGGCFLALGNHACALMSNHPPLAQDLLAAGNLSGDRAWELPLWEEYGDALKSEFADLANIPTTEVGARTIIAGCFLAKFTENFQWAHLDVANTATSTGKRGSTGKPISMLVHYLLARSHSLDN